MKSKRGQLEISFGMIFSIILIIAFLAFAFYAINHVVGMSEEIKLKQFSEDVQQSIDTMWKSSYGTKSLGYVLPNKAEQICFENPDEMSIHFGKRVDKKKLNHVGLEIEENGKDFFCIKVIDNKVNFSISKAYGEPLVKVTK